MRGRKLSEVLEHAGEEFVPEDLMASISEWRNGVLLTGVIVRGADGTAKIVYDELDEDEI